MAPIKMTRVDSITGKQVVNETQEALKGLVGGQSLLQFVKMNRVLLNALIRSTPSLLEKSLKALVEVKPLRGFLDFDVKRKYFSTLLKRKRSSANRRYGSVRLNVRRDHIFEDSYHQLRLRSAEEMRGRLSVNFAGEEGVDAGGVSREFYAVLAREMFNPNYALFVASQDGCTFSPNENSYINGDHLSYFKFIGRIVGKAICDGFLLDAHFTRSFYKHCLGDSVDHHDMQAVDPEYYKNLKSILNYNLEDLGLELTFSDEKESFGRMTVRDLIPKGRTIAVTEQNKGEYVKAVCENRLTNSIRSQLDAFLTGLHELVDKDLLALFNARELELLISGMPRIDIDDLRANTEYNGGYKATDRIVGWFWKIVWK